MKALVLLAVLVALQVLAPAASAAAPTSALSVTPGSLDRYSTYTITVIGPANASFSLDVYGSNSFHLDLGNRTDTTGVWRSSEQAWYDFGEYDVHLVLGNVSEWSAITVVCDARCQSDILLQNGLQEQQLTYALVTQYGTWVLLAVLAFEIPRNVFYFRDRAKRSKERGAFTDREAASSAFVRLRGFIQPGDQVYDPKNVQNPRIAADMHRRQLLEQLHEATGRRFLEWRPKHIEILRAILHDLEVVYGELATVTPEPTPWASEYVRPKEEPGMTDKEMETYVKGLRREQALVKTKSQGATLEKRAGSAPIVGPESTSGLNHSASRRPRVLALKVASVAVFGLGFATVVLIGLAWIGIRISELAGLWAIWPTSSRTEDAVKIFVIGVGSLVGAALLWALARSREARPQA